VKDTTIVRADTRSTWDTVSKTNHIAAGARTSAGPATLQWGPQPPGLPGGCPERRLVRATVQGWSLCVRVDSPRWYQVRAHWHPTSERLRVSRGPCWWAMDESGVTESTPTGRGQETTMAARHRTTCEPIGKTMIEIRSTGPFEITM